MRQDLIRQLAALQRRESRLEEFELWLVGHLQQIIDEGDQELRQYADKLDALLVQFGEDIISAVELDQEIEGTLESLSTVRENHFVEPLASRTEGSAVDSTSRLSFIDLGAVQDWRLPVLEVV